MTRAIDLRADAPLHRQVATTIASSIARGELAPGDRLPSERVLVERFGVSRATVRRALRELAGSGLVEAQQGRGSFVSAPAIGEDRSELLSFTELGAERGLTASAEVLEAGAVPATLEEAERFGIAPGADVFTLERLRSLNGLAVSLDRARVPLERAPHLPTVDFTTASLYTQLGRVGMTPVSAGYTVRAGPADARLASLLGVAIGSPLLLTTTTGAAANGRIIELGEMAYRADRYRFQATLVRRSPVVA